MLWSFKSESWCREFRAVFEESGELVVICERHNVAEAHRDLSDHSSNNDEVVGAKESFVFEVHEEVMGPQKICTNNWFVDIRYLEKPNVFVLVDTELHAASSIRLYS